MVSHLKDNRIPKIIHYCWFGGGEKPIIVKKCIASWKKHLPDYQIIEWNEVKIDITSNLYIQEAYEHKKYAFVSDYIRVYALYHYGGIYLDTDTEVFQSLEQFLEHESFWGFEEKNFIATSLIGAKKGNGIIKAFLDSYENKRFILEDGSFNTFTNVAFVSNLLKEKGLKLDGTYQELKGLGVFYPQVFFSPYDYINCYSKVTTETYAMHHFYKSWLPWDAKVKASIKKIIVKVIGGEKMEKLREKIFL